MWRNFDTPDPEFTDSLEIDIGDVESSMAGPKRPQDRISLSGAAEAFEASLAETRGGTGDRKSVAVPGRDFELADGDVVIAAITSCTNTSNPNVLITKILGTWSNKIM